MPEILRQLSSVPLLGAKPLLTSGERLHETFVVLWESYQEQPAEVVNGRRSSGRRAALRRAGAAPWCARGRSGGSGVKGPGARGAGNGQSAQCWTGRRTNSSREPGRAQADESP